MLYRFCIHTSLNNEAFLRQSPTLILAARCNLRKDCLTFVSLLAAAVFISPAAQSQWRTPWSYNKTADGPAHWATLDPEYAACAGKEQSPIDLRSVQRANLSALRFEFKPGPLKIINNGYTAVRVDYAPGNGNVLLVGDERYELTQFHFHHPSEERIHGKQYDMVIHFMLRASNGKIAGVAVLVNAGPANPAVRQL